MINAQHARRIATGQARYSIAGCALTLLLVATTAFAQQNIIVIGNDRGGLVGARAAEISEILTYGARVEIRGNICYSSCTMYLGAGNVCIAPATAFGFHGPSDYGRPLSPERFDHWSRVMARYYREPLRGWFMSSARYESSNLVTISGAQLINMGYSQC